MLLSNSRIAVSRWMGTFGGAIASVLFPSECRLCDALLTRATRLPICDPCLQSFQQLPVHVCERCGQPWSLEAAEEDSSASCRECRERGFAFHAARSFGLYQGSLARAIVLLKYEQLEPLGIWFARRLQEVARNLPEKFAADRDRSRASPSHSPERARFQSSRPVWTPARPPAPAALPPRAFETRTSPPGKAFVTLRRTMGGRTWRFCYSRGRPG